MDLVFQFESLSDFMMMSGHGPYVWAAYAITMVGMVGLVVQNRIKRRQLIKKIKLVSMRLDEAL